MLETIVLAALGVIAKAGGSFAVKKLLNSVFSDKRAFARHLYKVLRDTVETFKNDHPELRNDSFLDYQGFEDIMLAYELQKDEEAFRKAVDTAMEEVRSRDAFSEPDMELVESFLQCFQERIAGDAKLKELTIEAHYKDQIFRNAMTLQEVNERTENIFADIRNIRVRQEKTDVGPERLDALLKNYHGWKSKRIRHEKMADWPYNIDEREFVRIFNYKYGRVNDRSAERGEIDCVDLIASRISTSPIFLVGYYGMGKTTIANHLFSHFREYVKETEEENVHPVLLSLNAVDIEKYAGRDPLAERVFEEITKPSDAASIKPARAAACAQIEQALADGRIAILFDGLDEAHGPYSKYDEFANGLAADDRLRVMLTSRMEFNTFFDTFETPFGKNGLAIELRPWGKGEWRKYFDQLKEIEVYRKEAERLGRLEKDVFAEVYKDLPERPLFLKMLTELYVLGEGDVDPPPELRSNLAYIYEQYLLWKIRDDLRRKDNERLRDEVNDVNRFGRTLFGLLKLVAVGMYGKEKGTQTLDEILDGSPTSALARLGERLKKDNLGFNDLDRIVNRSTIFSTLMLVSMDDEKDSPVLKFSHESFKEYLVGAALADTIVRQGLDVKDARCGDLWCEFQTHEVSAHFMSELDKRRAVLFPDHTHDTDPIKPFLQQAFTDVIHAGEKDFREYDERMEEAVYYSGKLEVADEETLAMLRRLADPQGIPEKHHPSYFRTACIALSFLGEHHHLEGYVRLVAKSALGLETPELYEMNRNIDINYYGKMNQREKMKPSVEAYIEQGQRDELNILRIFGYFTSLKAVASEEFLRLKKELETVSKEAEKRKHFGDLPSIIEKAFLRINEEYETRDVV